VFGHDSGMKDEMGSNCSDRWACLLTCKVGIREILKEATGAQRVGEALLRVDHAGSSLGIENSLWESAPEVSSKTGASDNRTDTWVDTPNRMPLDDGTRQGSMMVWLDCYVPAKRLNPWDLP
jgi:hypothetical protein